MVFSDAAFHYATANSAYANLRAECQQALIYCFVIALKFIFPQMKYGQLPGCCI